MARPIQIPAGDIGKRQSAIQKMLAANIEDAYDQLIDFAESFGSTRQHHDAIVISRQYFAHKRANRQEELDYAEFTKLQDKLCYRGLDLMEEIVRDNQPRAAA